MRLRSLRGGSMPLKQNYQQKLESKRIALLASGLVSERWPGVSNIVLRMTYYQQRAGQVLMERTMNFTPADYACFHLTCTRDECTNGGFDLTPVVTRLFQERKKTEKGNIVCNGKNETLRRGHSRIAYEICIQYQKAGKNPVATDGREIYRPALQLRS